MITYKIQARTDQTNKNGLSSMYVRVYSGDKENKFNLPIEVDLKHFKAKDNTALKGMTNFTWVNMRIKQYEQKAGAIIHEHELNDTQLTFESFKFQLLKKEDEESSGCFYEFIKRRLAQCTLSYNSQRNYRTLTNTLKEYKSTLTFNDVNYNFIIGLKLYLKVTRNNCENTSNKALCLLRSLIYEAMRQDLMKENPFKKISINKVTPHREFLELPEVEALQKIYNKETLKPHQQNVLQYFLFACYTGLRFSDVEQFNTDMIVNNKISIAMEKTNETVVIPVLPQAKKLLPVAKQFNVTSNQKTNDAIKGIMQIAEIKKTISFHCARHTFATVAISSGIPVEVISKLLGHNDLKTTMIYAKIMDDVKVDAMKLWGKKKKVS